MGQRSGGQVKIEFDRNMLNETRDMIWEQNDNAMNKPPQRKTPALRREQSAKTGCLYFSDFSATKIYQSS